uniref:Uncharacterized protein n=1 Tax=Ditylenchus dipsaci TaxID=166011 RepID=A0A915CXP3_9BILA
MRRSNASMEEGEILDESVIELTDETACEDGEGLLNATSSNGNTNGDQDDGAQSSSAAGPAISKGTPILMSNTICSGQFNHEVVKPKLESWTHDILPFQHQNIVEETGFFKKMLSIVKGSRKKL